MKEEWKSTKSFLRRKAQRRARIETVCRKKAKVDPGIEPGPLGQISVALPLALPPLPKLIGSSDRNILKGFYSEARTTS